MANWIRIKEPRFVRAESILINTSETESAMQKPRPRQWRNGNKRGDEALPPLAAKFIRDDCIIEVLVDGNPKEDTASEPAFDLYKDGQSVSEYCASFKEYKTKFGVVKDTPKHHIAWDFNHTFIDVYSPEPISSEPEVAYIDDSINDLGSDFPERITSTSNSYKRDPRVRTAVLLRAKGKCEFCGQLGFITRKGERYLESHHIIAMANDGPDRMTNVIALCPSEHREAHFGQRRDALEKEMMIKLGSICAGQ